MGWRTFLSLAGLLLIGWWRKGECARLRALWEYPAHGGIGRHGGDFNTPRWT